MAIFHLSMKPISRATGRSSVAAIAYRVAERLLNERDGLIHDYSRRQGVEHAEIVIPFGSEAEWAFDRSKLWNKAETCEKRKDSRTAREFVIALPHELSAQQRLELTREFAQGLADKHGTAVDFAIHAPQGSSDERNHHAHLMMTTRVVTPDGLGEKTTIERSNKWLASRTLPLTQFQLVEIRQNWERTANAHLAQAGLEIQIDHRSHVERGLEMAPTEHMGVHATQMERRGLDVARARLDAEAAQRNVDLIREKPEQVLTIITGEKSVFDRLDVARALHRYVDGAQAFQSAFAQAMASSALVELAPETRTMKGEVIELARYSTREMVEIEGRMGASADRMNKVQKHSVAEARVEAALAARSYLSDEQREAVRHVTGEKQIAAVLGLAGAGKSTMLFAAREAWEQEGYRVHGAALAGKAAEGLEESSGIASRTLASWENGWKTGRNELGPRDVLVVDEAGMVSSKQLAHFVGEAERTGAKLVLVGDPEQLQAIQAGAAFRSIAERIGSVKLEGVRRQGQDWQRQASQDFARHRTEKALLAYDEKDLVRFAETPDKAREEIVRDVIRDMAEHPDASRVVLAHRRDDVRELNQAIRAARQKDGELSGERAYATANGMRNFAPGDRVLFLENNRDLGLKNGTLGIIQKAEEGRLVARLDTAKGQGLGQEVSVSTADYAALDHGYATTIHKAQGATVDRTFVLGSGSMDRHLTYVAMTRHREEAKLYVSSDEFQDVAALSQKLGRAGQKETTLDYIKDFAEQRGMVNHLGISSEIIVPAQTQAKKETQARSPLEFGDVREHAEEAKAAFAHWQEFGPDREEEDLRELSQSMALRNEREQRAEHEHEAELPQALPPPDADFVQESAQVAKRAYDEWLQDAIEEAKREYYKYDGAMKAREAFEQEQARLAQEREREILRQIYRERSHTMER